jgi:hypothetical protein
MLTDDEHSHAIHKRASQEDEEAHLRIDDDPQNYADGNQERVDEEQLPQILAEARIPDLHA